jgi:hypothetical protein
MTEHLIFLITTGIHNNQVFGFLATMTSTLIPGLTPPEGTLQRVITPPLRREALSIFGRGGHVR